MMRAAPARSVGDTTDPIRSPFRGCKSKDLPGTSRPARLPSTDDLTPVDFHSTIETPFLLVPAAEHRANLCTKRWRRSDFIFFLTSSFFLFFSSLLPFSFSCLCLRRKYAGSIFLSSIRGKESVGHRDNIYSVDK